MGHRLSKITTRTGDDGTTGLGDGLRLPKHATRIAALGDIDELNSVLGVLLTESFEPGLQAALRKVQNDLFDLGGELSIPDYRLIADRHLEALEALVAQYNAELPPLKEFILPGGTRAAALCHHARTVCRRAERTVAALQAVEPVSPLAIKYLNRLSDLLFVAARAINRAAGLGDVQWSREQP